MKKITNTYRDVLDEISTSYWENDELKYKVKHLEFLISHENFFIIDEILTSIATKSKLHKDFLDNFNEDILFKSRKAYMSMIENEWPLDISEEKFCIYLRREIHFPDEFCEDYNLDKYITECTNCSSILHNALDIANQTYNSTKVTNLQLFNAFIEVIAMYTFCVFHEEKALLAMKEKVANMIVETMSNYYIETFMKNLNKQNGDVEDEYWD